MDENATTPKENSSKGKKILKHVGRSGALINCIQIDNKYFIQKKSLTKPEKLKSQFLWLKNNQEHSFIPRVFEHNQTKDHFSYEMEFYENHQSSFEVLIKEGQERGVIIIEKLLSHIASLNTPTGRKTTLSHYKTYIQEKLVEKLTQCSESNPKFKIILSEEKIIINGKQYLNFPLIFKELHTKKVSSLFSELDMCNVHGDITLENVLIDDLDNLILLDPNDENILSTFHLDIGKLFQSLHSEYEYLLNIKDYTVEERKIYQEKLDFHFLHLKNHLLNKYEKEDLIIIKFHEAVHLTRLLPYILNKEESLWRNFLNLSIIRLNEFLQEVEEL